MQKNFNICNTIKTAIAMKKEIEKRENQSSRFKSCFPIEDAHKAGAVKVFSQERESLAGKC